MLKLFFSLFWVCIPLFSWGSSPKDSVPRPRPTYRIGIDLARPITLTYNNYGWVELQLEKLSHTNSIAILEGGFGAGTINTDLLKYSSNGGFLRLGLEKNILDKLSPRDFESAHIGFRYGMAVCAIGASSFLINDVYYGSLAGQSPGRTVFRHWLEIDLGMKMQLLGPWYIGWQMRGAYKFNKPETTLTSPVVIPGFGRGDRNTSVLFNIYLSYRLGA